MENGAISDLQISASSQWDAHHAPPQGRLHFKRSGVKQGSWSARVNDGDQWLQVDLGSQYTKVTGVATQGRNGHPQWVKKYKLQYSEDGVSFQYYKEPADTEEKVSWTLHIAHRNQNSIVSFMKKKTIKQTNIDKRTKLHLVKSSFLWFDCVWFSSNQVRSSRYESRRIG